MNFFADLSITLNAVLLVAEELPVTMVHRGRGHDITCRLFDDRVELEVAGGNAEAGLQDLASPGVEVSVAGRSFHLQLLRQQGTIVGPLLVFEEGVPVPCIHVGEDEPTPDSMTAQLPVFLTSAQMSDAARREIKECLNLCAKLLKGVVSPGLEDDAYFGVG